MAGGSDPVSSANTQRLRSEFAFMYELCQVVASNADLQPILDWIARKTTSMFSADEGSIRLLGEDPGPPTLKTLIRKEQPGIHSGSWPSAISTNVMGFLMARGEPLATPDLPHDPRFPGLQGVETRIRSVLAVPLKVGNRFTGMLAVTRMTPGRQWTENEVQLLSMVAINSASVIEQARLKIEAEDKRRYDRELETARGIQMSLLPAHPLRLGPWEAVGRVVPARQVGGDAFEYFPLRDGRLAIAIADVSGTGVPAALLMANVQASVRALCDGRMSIPAAMRSVNESIVRSASGRFVTLFYGEIDPREGMIRYANAGHNYPLVCRRDGSLVELVEGGLPLGVTEQAAYEAGGCPLVSGDALLLYSDGITEALDLQGQEFGEARLRAAWQQVRERPPAEAMAQVFAEVEAFRGRAVQGDDMTVVIVGRSAVPDPA